MITIMKNKKIKKIGVFNVGPSYHASYQSLFYISFAKSIEEGVSTPKEEKLIKIVITLHNKYNSFIVNFSHLW